MNWFFWRELQKMFLSLSRYLDTPTSPEGLTNRPAEVLSYDQKVSLLGRPKLGESTRLQIRVKESKEFKVCPSLFTFSLSLCDYFVCIEEEE